MVDGLEPGSHVIEFGGGASAYDFSLDVTYEIEVQEHGNDMLLM
jgi:hypothetical protein